MTLHQRLSWWDRERLSHSYHQWVSLCNGNPAEEERSTFGEATNDITITVSRLWTKTRKEQLLDFQKQQQNKRHNKNVVYSVFELFDLFNGLDYIMSLFRPQYTEIDAGVSFSTYVHSQLHTPPTPLQPTLRGRSARPLPTVHLSYTSKTRRAVTTFKTNSENANLKKKI